jgi:hypothetical protein
MVKKMDLEDLPNRLSVQDVATSTPIRIRGATLGRLGKLLVLAHTSSRCHIGKFFRAKQG